MTSGIEEQIQQAMREGKFDDLPGKGRPLQLDDNPFEDPETRAANRMLRSAGFTLPWIEKRKEILAGMDEARAELRRSWAWCGAARGEGQPEGAIAAEWQRATRVFCNRLEDLNRRIRLLNLEVPSPAFQVLPLDPERELQLTVQTASDTL